MSREQHRYKGDARETGRPPIEAKTESRASSKHPDYNEDAAIGDPDRIAAELQNLPPLSTREKPQQDVEALQAALAKEAEFAPKLKERGVFGVLDGVSGGSNGGGLLASRIASGKVAEIMSYMPKDANAERARRSIEAAIQAAHQAVTEHKDGRPELKQMATTIDLVKTIDNGDGTFDVAYGHVGDSRIYVLDGETGQLRAETLDDGMAKFMLDQGKISRAEYDQVMSAPDKDSLPDHLQTAYQYRNMVTNAVGMPGQENIAVSTGILKLKKGDRMLLSSDGIHDNLTQDQIADIMRKGGGVKELADAAGAIASSGEGRAKPDDITGSVIEFGGEGREKGREAQEQNADQNRAAQLGQWKSEVDQAKAEIARLEALKQVATLPTRGKTGRADVMIGMDSGAINELMKLGGEKGVDKMIRDWKIFSLSREYQLTSQSVAERQQEAGLTGNQAQEQLAVQRQIIEWQKQVFDAARSSTAAMRGMVMGTSIQALEAVSQRMKAGEKPQDIMRQARESMDAAKAKSESLETLAKKNARLQEIAGEWHNLEGQKREEIAQAERSQMDQARRNLEAAAPPQEAQPQQPAQPQQQQPKKKGFFSRFFGG